VVRDEQARSAAIERVVGEARALGLSLQGQADAVLAGPEGNREHFVWLHKP
jgi:predicted rRNA methylase YqxC with S4 and FtsJ domains